MDGERIVPVQINNNRTRDIVVNVDRTTSLASRVIDACCTIFGPGRLEIETRQTYKWITDKAKVK